MIEHRDIGFLKLKRTILDWEWYQDNNTFRLMIHLLLKANYTVKQWQGNTINPGELITSIGNLSKELSLSENVIRTCLNKLKKTKYITTQGTNKFTIVKINKSTIYDETVFTNNKQIDKPVKTKSQADHKQVTTTNTVKKDEEKKESIENFENQVFQFSKFYSQEHLKGFYEYYSVINIQTGHRKFEEINYWNIEERLKTWKVLNSKTNNQSFIKNR